MCLVSDSLSYKRINKTIIYVLLIHMKNSKKVFFRKKKVLKGNFTPFPLLYKHICTFTLLHTKC
jgi:hypothetical protein